MTIGKPVENEQQSVNPLQPTHEEPKSWPELPQWALKSNRLNWGERLNILEWDDCDNDDTETNSHDHDTAEYRLSNGWKGSDLVHSKSSPVRVLEYRLTFATGSSSADTISGDSSVLTSSPVATLTGIVHFTKNAESHKGFCHGGSMCSIMDDIIGWTGFCATGTCIPWSGFTVQVNSKLCKPVHIGAILKITCCIEKIEGRKVWLKAYLTDPSYDSSNAENDQKKKDMSIHAIGEGLLILNKGVMEAT